MKKALDSSPLHVVDLAPWRDRLLPIREACRWSPEKDIHEFFDQAERVFHSLPNEAHRLLGGLRRGDREEGFILFKGFPVDPSLVATPLDSRRPAAKETWVSEFWLAVISFGLGEVFAYKDQTSGELFHNVCPTPESVDDDFNAECSRVELTWHTDGYGHPLVPDYVGLFCLRGAQIAGTAQTRVAPLARILPRLSKETVETLHQPLFRVPVDPEFHFPVEYLGTLPILRPTALGSQFNHFDVTIECLGSEAERAFGELAEHAMAASSGVELEAGDLIVIDNRASIHGRTPFSARFDGHDRWLQTAYIKQDLRSISANVSVRDYVAEVTHWPKEN